MPLIAALLLDVFAVSDQPGHMIGPDDHAAHGRRAEPYTVKLPVVRMSARRLPR